MPRMTDEQRLIYDAYLLLECTCDHDSSCLYHADLAQDMAEALGVCLKEIDALKEENLKARELLDGCINWPEADRPLKKVRAFLEGDKPCQGQKESLRFAPGTSSSNFIWEKT